MKHSERLYHGSGCQDIAYLEPRCVSKRQDDEGDILFASPSKALASCFMIAWDDSWATVEELEDGSFHFVTCDIDRLRQNDKGGSIYTLMPDDFKYDASIGMGYQEWTSTETQLPLKEEKYLSAIEAMAEQGIHFVIMAKDEFKSFMSMTDHEKQNLLSKQRETDPPVNDFPASLHSDHVSLIKPPIL